MKCGKQFEMGTNKETRILIFTDDIKRQEQITKAVGEFSWLYFTKSMQEGLFYLTAYAHHLVVISFEEEREFLCELVETIRKLSLVPILVIRSKYEINRKKFLVAGADVVITEPCDIREIELQVFAMIRRYLVEKMILFEKIEKIEVGELSLDYSSRVVEWKEIYVSMTGKEFDFLYLLAATPGRVYTYSQIYQRVWKEYPQDDVKNMIYCLVHRLKKKLRKTDVKACDIICSVKQVGYCLKVNNE